METEKYFWQQAYFAALTETQAAPLATRVAQADDAIFERLLELEGSTGTEKERMALESTLGDLRVLRNYSYLFSG